MPSTAFHSLPQCAARRVRRSGAGLRVQYRLHTRRLAFKLQLLSPAMRATHGDFERNCCVNLPSQRSEHYN